MIAERPLALLEFPRLLAAVSAHAQSDASRTTVLAFRPLARREQVEARFGLVAEIARMADEGDPLPMSPFPDLSGPIDLLRPEDAVLDPGELAGFLPFFRIAHALAVMIGAREDVPLLKGYAGALTGHPDLLDLLERSVDAEGHVLDDASPALGELRAAARRKEAGIRKNLDEMVREERTAVFLQDDFVTKRSGRWVIPVRMDARGQVPGVVHDISKSGETAFVEPLRIIHLSNELENLLADQKAEEMRILRDICSRMRGVLDDIGREFRLVVSLDALNAVVRFAGAFGMTVPSLNEEGVISLAGARHPLLAMAFRKTGMKGGVVPLDIGLGGEDTVMVVTGSNAGGKTVAIKTIGLLTVMALSGMPIPADASSSIPFVRNLLIDIGDEQSIEESLSTFSAHVSRLSEIIEHAGKDALVLIDELGTGTDPDEGTALACAVLAEMQSRGALVFATTHLTGIKGYVHRTPGMVNASMEFDVRTHTPLYRLRAGEPGLSHALETAERFGLPARVVRAARSMLGEGRVEFERMMADLAAKRHEYGERLAALDRQRKRAEEEKAHIEERRREIEARKKEILGTAYREAEELLRETRRRMQILLEEAKKRDRETIREGVRDIERRRMEVEERRREVAPDGGDALAIGEIREGDRVFIPTLGVVATVVNVLRKQERVRVKAGGTEVEVPVADLRGTAESAPREREERAGTAVDSEGVSPRLNLVGMRVDEAISRLEPYLNHAVLAGMTEVTVIHGIGKGLLASAVREHLTGHPLVARFRTGEIGEGGPGVTVVTLA